MSLGTSLYPFWSELELHLSGDKLFSVKAILGDSWELWRARSVVLQGGRVVGGSVCKKGDEGGVLRLQEQLQAERDLRAALEVGLSMSSGQDSGSNRAMDSKVAKKDVTSRYHHWL
ncbi:hypothetical protein Tco_0412322 [Tanacetum coccineum]